MRGNKHCGEGTEEKNPAVEAIKSLDVWGLNHVGVRGPHPNTPVNLPMSLENHLWRPHRVPKPSCFLCYRNHPIYRSVDVADTGDPL